MGVLVVEDSEAIGKMLVQVLERAGFEAKWTDNVEDALSTAAEWIPDVVLLDLHLGDAPGIEVAKKLRKSAATSKVRVIGLSGDPPAKAEQKHLDGFLLKPVALAAVVEAVRG
ncbi:MAG: response regulator [Actinomycetota bacterium]|nr:response regulator [Actinomycetota bacterium]